jgi:hypothetical protein
VSDDEKKRQVAAIIARDIKVPALEAEIARLREALKALVTAVTFADPPKVFNEVLCHEARVPVEFVTAARAALAQETQP